MRRASAAVAALLTGASLVVAGAAAGTGSAGGPGLPLVIESASLSQAGQQVAWRVGLRTSFSPQDLARDGRSLCLLIEGLRGAVSGQICLAAPPRHSRTPRLVYQRITGGRSGPLHTVPATIARSSSRDLTATFLPSAAGIAYAPMRWQVISTLSAAACASPRPGGGRCFVLYPTRPALLDLHVPQLAGCVPAGPTWVFHGPTNVKEIALTFDDGPWSDTPRFLSVLEREHVVATFFQIGDQIAQYGEHGVDRRMLIDGDMIGDHTWNYGGNVAAGGADAGAQIKQAAAAIRTATGGFQPCLFRAPGGNVTPALLRKARSLGFTTIQWNVDPRDWTRPGARSIYDNVVAGARNGAIVIQHDGGGERSQTLAALPKEIATLRRRGFRFVTVTQMLGYTLRYR